MSNLYDYRNGYGITLFAGVFTGLIALIVASFPLSEGEDDS